MKSLKDILSALPFGKQKKRPVEIENHGAHLITETSSTRVLEAYRMARTNLFYSGNGEGGTVFGITSASPSDGKSITCANLAISFAMSGKRVLLVDCDMRKPTQKLAFDVNAANGLSEYLAGVVAEPEIVPTSYEGLSLLASGKCPPNPAELLFRPRFAELIEAVKKQYDFVFIDLPPVGLISDATVVAPHVCAYILVVRMNVSDYRVVRETVESIEGVGGKIAGFMLNDVDDGSSHGRIAYGKYGKYGRYYGKYYGHYEKAEAATEAATQTEELPKENEMPQANEETE